MFARARKTVGYVPYGHQRKGSPRRDRDRPIQTNLLRIIRPWLPVHAAHSRVFSSFFISSCPGHRADRAVSSASVPPRVAAFPADFGIAHSVFRSRRERSSHAKWTHQRRCRRCSGECPGHCTDRPQPQASKYRIAVDAPRCMTVIPRSRA